MRKLQSIMVLFLAMVLVFSACARKEASPAPAQAPKPTPSPSPAASEWDKIVEAAKKEGVPEDQMMLVAGEVEILAAMNASRADAAVETYFGALEHVKKSNGRFEVTDPADMPKWTQNWVGIGFRKADTDFHAAFNKAMAKVIGGEKWMKATAPYGYSELQLPGPDASTAYACANR